MLSASRRRCRSTISLLPLLVLVALQTAIAERLPIKIYTPQLFVPNGHPGNSFWTIDANYDGLADDVMIEIPAVGAAGGDPLPGFLQGIFGP